MTVKENGRKQGLFLLSQSPSSIVPPRSAHFKHLLPILLASIIISNFILPKFFFNANNDFNHLVFRACVLRSSSAHFSTDGKTEAEDRDPFFLFHHQKRASPRHRKRQRTAHALTHTDTTGRRDGSSSASACAKRTSSTATDTQRASEGGKKQPARHCAFCCCNGEGETETERKKSVASDELKRNQKGPTGSRAAKDRRDFFPHAGTVSCKLNQSKVK